MDGPGQDVSPDDLLGQGVRPPWSSVTPHVLEALTRWLGEPINEVREVRGGFTPTVAARVSTRSGRAFVKVCGPGSNAQTPTYVRQELRIAAELPDLPCLSPLRWSFDDGEWVALAFDDLGGITPTLPWTDASLDAAIEGVAAAHDAVTPSPIGVETAEASLAGPLSGWTGLTGAEPGLDPWSRRHLPTLAGLGGWPAIAGDTLLHCDVRADNLLEVPGRGTVLVDWAAASTGPRWLDLALWAPSVTAQGGPSCTEVLQRAGVDPPPAQLAWVAASFAGYLTASSLRPPPPGLATLRAFQAAHAIPTRAWAAELLGLEPPASAPTRSGMLID